MMRRLASVILASVVVTSACQASPAPTFPQWSDGVTACAEEDGSTPGQPFPCRWESARSGNGLGELDYTLTGPVDYDPSALDPQLDPPSAN